jgi:translation initiation factor 4E
MFQDSHQVCGAVVSVRKHADRLSLWTASYSDSDSCMRLGTQWKQIMQLGPGENIGFQAHDEAIQNNASFANKDKFSV